MVCTKLIKTEPALVMLILAYTVMKSFHQFFKFSCVCGIFPASEIMCQIVCNLLKAICDLSLRLKRNNSICWLHYQRFLDREKTLKREERQFFLLTFEIAMSC